jgi:tetratricopeptide (TPR) repeat protein
MRMTPADELRELVARSEVLTGSRLATSEQALELLRNLDRIAELAPMLEASGVDLRAEKGRIEALQGSVRRAGPRVVTLLAAEGGMTRLRDAEHPGNGAAWWWRLDETVAADRRSRHRRLAVIAGSAALVVIAGVLIVRTLFPTDPAVTASLRFQAAAELRLMEDDLLGALEAFTRAADSLPEEPAGWLRVGAVHEKLGRTQEAQASFTRARAVADSEATFLVERASVYLGLGMIDQAEADLDAVLRQDPENALAHFNMATVYEEQGDLQRAAGELESASALSEQQRDDELTVMARYRLGMLIQQMAIQGPARPEASPAP